MEDCKKVNGETISQILGNYSESQSARFHMPGHKGRGFFSVFQADIAKWDITELSFSDNLHSPSGAIQTAQERMAEAYGAERSFFVVTGSTTAVQAMILSLDPSEKLLICRDAHKAAVHALALSGMDAEYLFPHESCEEGIMGMPSPEQIATDLDRTGATALFLTSPNYYGFCADIQRIGKICRERDVLLLVDSAHGAHFPFSDELPEGMSGHADAWTHSQHKTMDALTPGASLHLGKCRIDPERTMRMLDALETSSPSYPVMASLDWSVFMGVRRDWTAHVRKAHAVESEICLERTGIQSPGYEKISGCFNRDRSRIILDFSGIGLTGYQVEKILESHGIFPEMADDRRIVCITTPADDPAWYERLNDACKGLPEGKQIQPFSARMNPAPLKRMHIREALFASSERVTLSCASGRIAAVPIGVYPPGIPMIYPGEEITEEMMAYLNNKENRGASLFGTGKGMVSVVR